MALIDPALREVIRLLVTGTLPWPLVLIGCPGSGKTCAALSILDHTIKVYGEGGHICGTEYEVATEFPSKIIDAAKGKLYSDRGSLISERSYWKRLELARAVVLDELGTRDRVDDWQYERIKKLIDVRHGKPFIVLSNITIAGLTKLYDDRITSRLTGGTVFTMPKVDRRQRK